MEHRLHQNEIATCGSDSYAGQNPTQQGSDFKRIVFLSSIRIFYLDVDSDNMISQGDMLSSNRGSWWRA